MNSLDCRALCIELLRALENEGYAHWVIAPHWQLCQRARAALSAPEPTPTFKEQALAALHAVATGANDTREQHQDLDTIRKALEALPQ